jgi:uncharacterized protein
MDVTPLLGGNQKIVQSYAAGRFRISGTVFETDVIVWGSTVLPWLQAPDLGKVVGGEDGRIENLISSLAKLEFLFGEIEILLVGSGERGLVLPSSARQKVRGICPSVEIMDTGAACRTFNVLTAEGRRVGASLLRI